MPHASRAADRRPRRTQWAPITNQRIRPPPLALAKVELLAAWRDRHDVDFGIRRDAHDLGKDFVRPGRHARWRVIRPKVVHADHHNDIPRPDARVRERGEPPKDMLRLVGGDAEIVDRAPFPQRLGPVWTCESPTIIRSTGDLGASRTRSTCRSQECTRGGGDGVVVVRISTDAEPPLPPTAREPSRSGDREGPAGPQFPFRATCPTPDITVATRCFAVRYATR